MLQARRQSGRIDLSELDFGALLGAGAPDGNPDALSSSLSTSACCLWCGESCRTEYIVLFEDQCNLVCTLCWGRSPGYLSLREGGMSHQAALFRIGVLPENE